MRTHGRRVGDFKGGPDEPIRRKGGEQMSGGTVNVSVTHRWSFERAEPGETPTGFVLLTFRLHPEDGQFVGICEELNISSFGATIDEALTQTMEAVTVYLETLEELGLRDKVFAEHGVQFFQHEPSGNTEIPVHASPGEVISSQRLVLVDA